MTSSYPIPPRLAEQAAKDYLAVVRAGLLPELKREIEETIQAHRGIMPGMFDPIYKHDAWHASRIDQWRDGGGVQLDAARSHARDLAALLDCPQHAVEPFVVPELISGATRRTIVLDVLRNLANYARSQRRTTPRRVCG